MIGRYNQREMDVQITLVDEPHGVKTLDHQFHQRYQPESSTALEMDAGKRQSSLPYSTSVSSLFLGSKLLSVLKVSHEI